MGKEVIRYVKQLLASPSSEKRPSPKKSFFFDWCCTDNHCRTPWLEYKTESTRQTTSMTRKKSQPSATGEFRSTFNGAPLTGAKWKLEQWVSKGTSRKATMGRDHSQIKPKKDARESAGDASEIKKPRPDHHIAKQIQEARMAKKMTQAALAKAVSVNVQIIQGIEKGQAHLLTAALKHNLRCALGVPRACKWP